MRATEALAAHIAEHGPIVTLVAPQNNGIGGIWCYREPVKYEIGLKAGVPFSRVVETPEHDIAVWVGPGRMTETRAEDVISALGVAA